MKRIAKNDYFFSQTYLQFPKKISKANLSSLCFGDKRVRRELLAGFMDGGEKRQKAPLAHTHAACKR